MPCRMRRIGCRRSTTISWPSCGLGHIDMTKLERRNLLKGLAFLSPWLIGFTVFTLLPIILSAYFSLCDYALLQPPVYRGTENYRALAHDPVFWQSMKVTAKFTVLALPLGMIVALMLALLLNVKILGQSIY